MSDQWQPIETAPKDGTPILVIDVHGCMAVVSWSDYWIRHAWIITASKLYGELTEAENLTHWHPVPGFVPVMAEP